MDEHGVRSYAIYETLGLFDLFIRAWLPSQTLERFEQNITDALEGEFLQLLEPFSVTRILRHHVWDGDDAVLREPAKEVLTSPWDDDKIERANAGDLSDEEWERYEGEHILARLVPKPGIKFFTVITSPLFSVTGEGRLRLEHGLLEILSKHKISEPSLYEGSGFGQFILMGRVPTQDFFEIPSLAYAINQEGISTAITARPYTHVCARQDLLHYSDALPAREARDEIDPLLLLKHGESHVIEVKASAKLDWKRWLSTDEPSPHDSEEVLNDGVIRAIVGMLNADGGHIVIGALEADRQFGAYKATDHPKLALFTERYGEYICVGINDEASYRKREWDGYRLQLQEVIAERIEPAPAGAISLTRWTLDDGRELCVVGVQPNRSTWFYRVSGPGDVATFFVREDGRTVAYAGGTADAYKRSRPRG